MRIFIFLFTLFFPIMVSAQLTKGKYEIANFKLLSTDGTEIGIGIIDDDKSFVRITETFIIFYFSGYPSISLLQDKVKKIEDDKFVYECINTESDKQIFLLCEPIKEIADTYILSLMRESSRIDIFSISKTKENKKNLNK